MSKNEKSKIVLKNHFCDWKNFYGLVIFCVYIFLWPYFFYFLKILKNTKRVGFSCFKNETLFSLKIPLEKSHFSQCMFGKMFFIHIFTSNHLWKMKQMKQICPILANQRFYTIYVYMYHKTLQLLFYIFGLSVYIIELQHSNKPIFFLYTFLHFKRRFI